MTFTAKYRGPCENCDDPVIPGQEVEYTADHHITHVVCPEDRDWQGKPLPVCPRCFTTRAVNGTCGCDPDE